MNDSVVQKFYTLEEDIKLDELGSSKQTLISIVVDKSYPLNGNNGLEKCIKKTIEIINGVFNMPLKQAQNLNAQVSITYFGEDVKLQPFRPTKHIEVDCVPNQIKSRIYDAIYESCMHIIGQYNYLNMDCWVKGYMFIFTDGEDNGSKHSIQEMNEALYEMKKVEIPYILVEYEGINHKHIMNIFNTKPIAVEKLSEVCRIFGFVSERLE